MLMILMFVTVGSAPGEPPLLENVVIDNVNDGSTSTDVIAPTNLIERLANNKKKEKK